jgi:hypothetical protein
MTAKSGEGLLSLQFKESVKVEAGRNSELVVNGSRGAYRVQLRNGSLLFRVPQNVSLVITTPTATVDVTAASVQAGKSVANSSADRIGTVTFDGKASRVSCGNGQFVVKGSSGADSRTLAKGLSATVGGADDGYAVRLAQGTTGQTGSGGFSSGLGVSAAAAAAGGSAAVAAAAQSAGSTTLVPAAGSLNDEDVGAHTASPRAPRPRGR